MQSRPRYCLGDTHSVLVTTALIKKANIVDSDIYHVGDGGEFFIELQKGMLEELDRVLRNQNCNLYVARGNHSNPEFWANGGYRTDNLWFVPDYTIVDKCLFLGGAVSIDRVYLLAKGLPWWPDEVFSYNPIVKTMTGVSDIISHNRPDFCKPLKVSPLVKEFFLNDHLLESMLLEERKAITQVFSELSVNNFINTFNSGHMHSSGVEYINQTKFNHLGIDEIKEF